MGNGVGVQTSSSRRTSFQTSGDGSPSKDVGGEKVRRPSFGATSAAPPLSVKRHSVRANSIRRLSDPSIAAAMVAAKVGLETKESIMNIQSRIMKALKRRKSSPAADETAPGRISRPLTIDRILLKLADMQSCLGYVKSAFLSCAENRKLSVDGLVRAMDDMDWKIDRDARREIFDYCAIHDPYFVELKEFLAALTVGILLEPNLLTKHQEPDDSKINDGTDNDDGALDSEVRTTRTKPHDPMKRILSQMRRSTFHDMLQLIISAYLLFDTEATGVIRKDDVEKLISASESGRAASCSEGRWAPHSTMLSRERWNEMDWAEDDTIDLAQFVISFIGWFDTYDQLDLDAASDDEGSGGVGGGGTLVKLSMTDPPSVAIRNMST